MPVSPARRAAYEVLLRVFEQDAYADRVFRTAARDLDERDRAFAQRLAYGAVQRVRTLDHAIDTLGRRPTRKLDPPVRAALRLGAYQLGYTDTAPHAAANESVELVRGARLERAVPFTNAVMRRLTEGIRTLLDELPDGALKESYPDWVADTFVRDLGDEQALALMHAMNEPLETVVRLVRGAPPRGAEPTDIPGGYRVERVDDLAVAEGRIWPQSRGSQLAGLVVGAQDGDRVLDLCAAPGGKTSQLAGDVTAVELDPNRARELRENLTTLARTNVTVVEADGTALPPELTGFDRALVDAPARGSACSRSARISAGARPRSPSSSSRCFARPPAASSRAGRSSIPSARSTPTRTRRSSTRAGSTSFLLTTSGRNSHIRAGRSSC